MKLSMRSTFQIFGFLLFVVFLNTYISLLLNQSKSNVDIPGQPKPVPVEDGAHRNIQARDVEHRYTKPDIVQDRKDVRLLKESSQISNSVKDVDVKINNNNDVDSYDSLVKHSALAGVDYDPEVLLAKSRPTELSDVFISVKTTEKYHKSRIQVILDTWFQLASQETYFFTDVEDHEFLQQSRGHMVNTNCSSNHNRVSLCCKMAVEYDHYIASQKRWFCHVDDDTYVNVPNLVQLLRQYNHTEDWYLGKPSLTHPLEVHDPDSNNGPKVAFWFGTGGAGFCLSRGLALKMIPYAGGGKFKNMCQKIRLPDDCTMGFIIYNYLKKELTVVKELHSHLEGLWKLKMPELNDQITFSYNLNAGKSRNIVHVDGVEGLEDDPTRFRSLHCYLYPYIKGCPQADST